MGGINKFSRYRLIRRDNSIFKVSVVENFPEARNIPVVHLLMRCNLFLNRFLFFAILFFPSLYKVE